MKIVMKVGQGECPLGIDVGQGECPLGMEMGQGERAMPSTKTPGGKRVSFWLCVIPGC